MLGVQSHCLRQQLAGDFAGTLERLAGMGLRSVELCSFPGFAGNPWGDFGELAHWPAGRIAAALDKAGMRCMATHVMARELTADRLDATIAWTRGVGIPAVVLAGFPGADKASVETWRSNFESLNETGRRFAAAGIRFAYHTQNDVWNRVDGELIADELFRIVDPALCAIELDPSGTLVYGTDWTTPVLQHPGRYLAIHLRDGKRPPAHVPYLPALALGEGDMDWPRTLDVAREAAVPHYLLEMEIAAPQNPFEALRTSLEFLESIGSIGG